jgi:hypothetical protein
LDIEDSLDVNFEEEYGLIMEEGLRADVLTGFSLLGDDIVDGFTVDVSDNLIEKIIDNSLIEYSEEDVPYGLYVETTIVDVGSGYSYIMDDKSEVSSIDDGPVYDNITISANDEFPFAETAAKDISAKDASEMIISDIVSTIAGYIETVKPEDDLNSYTELLSESATSYEFSAVELYADSSTIGREDSVDTIIELIDDTSPSIGDVSWSEFNVEEEISISKDEKNAIIVAENIMIIDESDVESENQIDS